MNFKGSDIMTRTPDRAEEFFMNHYIPKFLPVTLPVCLTSGPIPAHPPQSFWIYKN